MIKKQFLLLIIICFAGRLSAQELSSPSMFAGLSPEINGFTRTGFAFGGSLFLGMDIYSRNDKTLFSLGQKTAFFTNFKTVRVVELLIFFRYYLPWLHWPKSDDGPFIQAEAGAALSMEHGYHIYNEVFPSFAGGASVGWRFNFPQGAKSFLWYIEPSARLGYPYIWGFGVTAGIRFKQRKNEEIASHSGTSAQRENNEFNTVQENERVTENIEKEIEIREIIVERIIERVVERAADSPSAEQSAGAEMPWQVLSFENDKGIKEHLLAVREDNNRLRIQTPSVVFRANHADFSGLSAALLDSNTNTLRRVAQTLNAYGDYRVLVEGHANPTTPEGAMREAEEPSLIQLSGERARRVADELVRLGVDRERIIITGMGSGSMLVPYDEHNNTWKNRRVEFILFR